MFASLLARLGWSKSARKPGNARGCRTNQTRLSLESLDDRSLPSSTTPTATASLQFQQLGKAQWIDINGDAKMQEGELFAPIGNKLIRIGEKVAEGTGAPGTIRWIDVNHDGQMQGNETFLFLQGGHLMNIGVGGRGAREWLMNDVRGVDGQGNNGVRAGADRDDANNGCPFGGWHCICVHGGIQCVDVKCNGNTTTTTVKFNDGTVMEVKEMKGKDGTVANRTTTEWNPDGSVTRTQETKNKDGSTTTTTTNWNPDGSGTMTKETKDKDGKTTRTVSAEFDNKGEKVKQTEDEGGKKKEWKKDPKSKAWSNSENESAKKPPNEQKGGLPDKLPPKPPKPK